MSETYRIDFEPLGRRGEARPGSSLLAAAQAAGVGLASVCGGVGTCEECRVRLMSGKLTPPTLVEESCLGKEALAAGYRLACQAEPLSDVKLDIPPESLTASQRLQLEGEEAGVRLAPAVRALDLELAAPSLQDLRADVARLRDALAGKGVRDPAFSLPVLASLPERLRAQEWRGRLVLRGRQAVTLLPSASRMYGLAVDIGTTKLAAYLVNLENGETVAQAGAMNPQVAYGEDAISRIAYAGREPEGGRRLQSALVETLNRLLGEMCAAAGIPTGQVVDAVLVGNTAMHHLFAGLPVRQLGQAPYVPAVSQALSLPARDLGLEVAPGAAAYLPPNIAGFVGADHVAMLLATGVVEASAPRRNAGHEGRSAKPSRPGGKTIIALDIGTNTEIALVTGGEITCCSCASGPAFEGAHIKEGMRAAPGAIERARWSDGRILWQSIEGRPPVGICGSGILDVVAAFLDGDMLKPTGVWKSGPSSSLGAGAGSEYVLVPAAQTGHGRDLAVTRKDVHEIQLAKSAIRSGIEVLLQDAGLGYEQVEAFIVAGAFGTYLDLRSAVRVGMFPPLPLERFRQVGNAAGVGARLMLLSRHKRREAEELAGRIHYIELTADSGFTPLFMKHLSFEPGEG